MAVSLANNTSLSLVELHLRRQLLEPLAILRGHVSPISVSITNHSKENPLVVSGYLFR